MVDGLKFGVDYLCYKDDPTKSHADLMVLVHDPEASLGHPIDIIAVSAVANKARKSLAIASLDIVTKSVEYLRLERIPVNVNKKHAIKLNLDDDELMDEINDS